MIYHQSYLPGFVLIAFELSLYRRSIMYFIRFVLTLYDHLRNRKMKILFWIFLATVTTILVDLESLTKNKLNGIQS